MTDPFADPQTSEPFKQQTPPQNQLLDPERAAKVSLTKKFSLQQMLWGTALLGFLCLLAIACPLYGPYQIVATLAILLGWWLLSGTQPPEIPEPIDASESATTVEFAEPAGRLGLAGAMLIWVGIVMSLFCLPACLVEATRPSDRMRDYDLHLEDQQKFPSNR